VTPAPFDAADVVGYAWEHVFDGRSGQRPGFPTVDPDPLVP
jgi:hypothetical protein